MFLGSKYYQMAEEMFAYLGKSIVKIPIFLTPLKKNAPCRNAGPVFW